MVILDLFSDKIRDPAECQIVIDGEEIIDLYPALVDVTVETDRKQASTARITFDTRRLDNGLWLIQDDSRIKTWASIQINAVFGARSEEVMRGFIRQIDADYPSDAGGAKAVLTCFDQSVALDRTHTEQRWGEGSPITDGLIATQIAMRHQLLMMPGTGDGQTVQDLLQNNTDIKFLQKRAAANGYELVFSQGMMHFGPMRLDLEPQATIKVYAGPDTNCIQISIQDDGHKPDQVAFQVAPESGSQGSANTVESQLTVMGNEPATSRQSGLGDFVWRPQREGVSDDTQMRAIAQQMADEQSMKITVKGELDGGLYGHVLRVAEPVGLDGAGDKYSGTFYVSSANHRFDAKGYRVTFTLLRNAYGDDLSESTDLLAGVR